MAERRRRRRAGQKCRTGCVTALVMIAILGAGAAYGIPWAIDKFGGQVRETFNETVENAVNTLQPSGADFPDLTVAADDVADHFYYQQLTEEEQTVYRELLQGVNDMEECILVHAGKGERPEKAYEYLLYDCPELFWCIGSSQMTMYDTYTEFYPEYSCSLEERETRQNEIDAAVTDCMAGIDASAGEYDRIRYVFEYLVNTVDYDENAPDNQNIYSALTGKRSVCAGYSRAAQYLLEKAGVECIYVTGKIRGQGAHAWNIVKCEGTYYQMDVTYGDPVFLEAESGENVPGNSINYDYLCCTDETLSSDHIQDNHVPYPACESDDLDYYRMNGMYYEYFDPDEFLRDMNQSIYEGEESFLCKFSDDSVYGTARDTVIDSLIPRAAENLADIYGLSRVRYTYVDDGPHRRISVFWDYGE